MKTSWIGKVKEQRGRGKFKTSANAHNPVPSLEKNKIQKKEKRSQNGKFPFQWNDDMCGDGDCD